MSSAEKPSSSKSGKPTDAPVVLSEGAAVALGSALSRFIVPPKGDSKRSKLSGKRPRADHKPVVLAENEQVQKELHEEREQKKRFKEQRLEKLKFENNSRVIPDAATGAALEKELLTTATKGAVALFNAVAKAQKAAEELAAKDKKKGPPVSRESFMQLLKKGINKSSTLPNKPDKQDDGDSIAGNIDGPAKSTAKWLKDDFLTSGAKKLKDWDKPDDVSMGSSEDEDGDAEDDDDEEDEEGSNEDSEVEEEDVDDSSEESS